MQSCQRMSKILKRVIQLIIIIAILVLGVSAYVSASTSQNIALSYTGADISDEASDALRDIDPQCILVLGCAVWDGNQPSPMLKDRLDTAIALYKEGAAPKLLLSGDNSIPEYSEPDCMLKYTLAQGVPPEDIFLDYAGFSTYESVYRSHAVFMADRLIVVTQKYHLFRALKACEALGIEAKGVISRIEDKGGPDEIDLQYYVRYRTEDGETIEGLLSNPTSDLQVGQPVDLKYHPKYKANARLIR